MKTKKIKFKNINNITKQKLTKKYNNLLKEKLKLKIKKIAEKHYKKYIKNLSKKNLSKNLSKKPKFSKSKKKYIQKGGSIAGTFAEAVQAAKDLYIAGFVTDIAGVISEVVVAPALAAAAGSLAGSTAEVAADTATPPPGDAAADLEDVAEASTCWASSKLANLSGNAAFFGAAALGTAAGGSIDAVLSYDQSRSSATDMYNKNKKETNKTGGTASDSASNTQPPKKNQKTMPPYPVNNTPGQEYVPGPKPNPYN